MQLSVKGPVCYVSHRETHHTGWSWKNNLHVTVTAMVTHIVWCLAFRASARFGPVLESWTRHGCLTPVLPMITNKQKYNLERRQCNSLLLGTVHADGNIVQPSECPSFAQPSRQWWIVCFDIYNELYAFSYLEDIITFSKNVRRPPLPSTVLQLT